MEKRKLRRRKKKLFNGIREQMEFYFSDANLRKDRFMGELVQENEEGYVDLEVFLTFHKIQGFTNDAKVIATALESSEILKLNEEKTRVKRVTKLEYKHDVDDCTLYVERIPLNADHNWLKTAFSKHGQVLYVSLPRYRHNGKIKGFAFVEFSSPEEVDKVCQHFGYQSTKKEGEDESAPLKDCASESQQDVEQEEGLLLTCALVNLPVAVLTRHNKFPFKLKQAVPAKKRKLDKGDAPKSEPRPAEAEAPEEKSTTEAESSDVEETKEAAASVQSTKKKKRKRKKKPRQSEAKEKQTLLVMPKAEWKRLRNKYLALQKATMAQIKRSLLPSHSAVAYSPRQCHSPGGRSPAALTVPREAPERGGEAMDAEAPPQTAPATLEFRPGVIVKLSTEKPVSNATEFKVRCPPSHKACRRFAHCDTAWTGKCCLVAEACFWMGDTINNIRHLANVAYVDVMEGDSVAYVRCADAESAQKFVSTEKESFCGSLSLLGGEEEKAYWEKINQDRETRRSQKTRQKKRGVEKASLVLEHQ
ncbi:lupus La ribonucleoprotein, putative [Ixodes scapularis]|uniref:La-related protein 7 n=1 Tax=Ixodes scapularis TaxID=6945 RepID=B7PEE2_IXOSC|nr:lupus La ribonucleoprotein, putative [Ixodes scapularis]|eukprot:XP_002433564.1 lupus La ribonucleoprotein, putative [Ixodes scapularis]